MNCIHSLGGLVALKCYSSTTTPIYANVYVDLQCSFEVNVKNINLINHITPNSKCLQLIFKTSG